MRMRDLRHGFWLVDVRVKWVYGIETDKGDIPIRKEKPSEYGTYKEHPY
jgi:hypothetical protein